MIFLKVLFTHKGRLNRKKFLLCHIPLFILVLPLSIVEELDWEFLTPYSESSLFSGILIITLLFSYIFFFYLCTFNVTAKRFHDLNMSGWYFLALLIPFYNLYLMYKLYFIKGTNESNRFGTDPLKII